MTDRIVAYKMIRQTSGPGMPIVIELAAGYQGSSGSWHQLNQLIYTLTPEQSAALLMVPPDGNKPTRYADIHDALEVILQAGGVIDGALI
jgi:hypothetical protein